MATMAHHVIGMKHWPTETVLAEHHPQDRGGMKFVIRFIGGKHHGIEIHCPTQPSTMRLFAQIIEYRTYYLDHPFLVAV